MLPMNKNSFESWVVRTLKLKPVDNLSGQAWIFFKKDVAMLKQEIRECRYCPRKEKGTRKAMTSIDWLAKDAQMQVTDNWH